MTARKEPSHVSSKMKVFLVDDHASMREALAEAIQRQPDLVVCGQAAEANQAMESIAVCKPDVAVVDISLEGKNGMELIKDIRVRCPRLAVLVFSMHDESLYAERAVRAGAQGYVRKNESLKNVIAAIRRVGVGELSLSEMVTKKLAQSALGTRSEIVDSVGRLSDKELEILRLIGKGYRTHEIARMLLISERTVETHRVHLRQKLNLRGAKDLLQYAIRWNQAGAS